jgi:glucose-1-phosphate thymidylyltransferase
MVRIAGRPILGHILSNLSETPIEDVILVVDELMGEQITTYAQGTFSDRFSFRTTVQKRQEGLGHAIYQGRDLADGEDLLITLGDMLFENGYQTFIESHRELGTPDASIGVKLVKEPSHYGVVDMDGDRVRHLVEKPDAPPSNYAISGVYIVENSSGLFNALEHLINNDIRGAGEEYQMTDALQMMVDRGEDLAWFKVEDWYDCGRPETLIEANRVLLSKIKTNSTDDLHRSVVIPPVDFGNDVEIESSVVGPNVSVDDGASITNSMVRETIVGRGTMLSDVNLDGSIVGDNAEVRGTPNSLNIGDNSRIDL